MIDQREIDEEEKKRIAMEAEMKAKLEEEEAERERIKAEEKRKRKEAEIKLKEERRLKRAEEKAAMVAEQAALSEAAKSERSKASVESTSAMNENILEDSVSKKRKRDIKRSSGKKTRRVSWESSDKLVQIKEFFQTDRVEDPRDSTKLNGNKIATNGDDEDHTESSASFREAFKVEKEKEAESLRKMKEEKLDLAYSEYCKKAISDEDFVTPKLVSIKKQNVIVKIRKKLKKKRFTPFSDKIAKLNSSIETYSVKARSQLQISTERQQWKQHTLPNIYDLGTDDDTIICQIISGSEMTENNEHTKRKLK